MHEIIFPNKEIFTLFTDYFIKNIKVDIKWQDKAYLHTFVSVYFDPSNRIKVLHEIWRD